MKFSKVLREVANNQELMYNVGRLAVEDKLIDFRDSCVSILGRNNGCVIKDKNGQPSDIIRLPIESAVKIAMLAMAEYFERTE